MRFTLELTFRILLATAFLCLAACTSEITFFVSRPPLLPVENIDNISIGEFENLTDEEISLPKGLNSAHLKSRHTLQPRVLQFKGNKNIAEFVKSMVVSGLSLSGQYRLVDIGQTITTDGESTPDATKTAIVKARVKYYEFNTEGSEKVFYLLLATKGGLGLRDQALLLTSREAVIRSAEKSQKGFRVETPYVEKIAALEVAFDLVRQSSGEKMVETQRFRAYYNEKWGGDENTSHLPQPLQQAIVTRYQKNETLAEIFKTGVTERQQALLDPDEFLARGGKLGINPSVVRNSLEIQRELAREVVDQYLKQISQYTEETKLKIASGDAIAVNYLKGNAYELAINRLKNIQRSEEDTFNLALAYESIANRRQAAKYYGEALNQNPGNKIYQNALKRVNKR
jgi:hypothetical protein